MKIIKYGIITSLMMASMIPVVQAEEITPTSHPTETTYQFSAGSLPSITVGDKIVGTPAPVVTLSGSSSSSEGLFSKSSKSVSNALAAVEINGQSIPSGRAQVIFHTP